MFAHWPSCKNACVCQNNVGRGPLWTSGAAMSVLMKVLLHRHHPSAELRNPQSAICHNLESDPELFLHREHTMPKAASKLDAAPSTPPWSISKAPVVVSNSSVPTTSLSSESTNSTVTVSDYGGPKKRESRIKLPLTSGLSRQNLEVGKSVSSKSEVSHTSQYPRATTLWIGEVDDAKSVDDLIASASIAGRPLPDLENLDFQDCKRTQENPIWKLQKTSDHSRRQSSIREEITYRQTDCLDDLRRLQKLCR